jgi:hypothetical protein
VPFGRKPISAFKALSFLAVSVVAILLFAKACSVDHERNSQPSPRPSQEVIDASKARLRELEAKGLILKQDGYKIQVTRLWYDLPYDSKRDFVRICLAARGGEVVSIVDGYTGKELASAVPGFIDVK